MIDQQEETEGGASGDRLGAPFSLSALSKGALTHHRWLVVVWPAAIVRPSGAAPPGCPSLPVIYQQTPTAAYASDAAASITGGLGAIGHQQAARIYTGALLATIRTNKYKRGLNIIQISAIL